MNDKSINFLVELLKQSRFTIALTGAGISKASGIPPFRGEDGIWNKYDPMLLDLNYFFQHPLESWKFMAHTFFSFLEHSEPNPAHFALAGMEEENFLQAIITQNIDCLHQAAGSHNVLEYHGGLDYLKCIGCGERSTFEKEILSNLPPVCSKCGDILKPDIVFFGENISREILQEIADFLPRTELVLVIGTSAEVYPASLIPVEAKRAGARIVEINPRETTLTNQISDVFISGKAEFVLPDVLRKLKEEIPP